MSQSQARSTRFVVSSKRAALGVAAVLLLSGCGGASGSDESASSRPSSSATATATPTATPTPTPTPTQEYTPASAEGPAKNVPLPKLPEAAKKETKEGLQAFGKYVIALFSYGYETGDVEPVKKVISSGCDLCANYFETVSAGFEGDDWLGGARLEVLGSTSVFKETPAGQYQLIIDMNQEPIGYYYVGGEYGEKEPSSRAALILEAEYANGKWHATELSTVESIK